MTNFTRANRTVLDLQGAEVDDPVLPKQLANKRSVAAAIAAAFNVAKLSNLSDVVAQDATLGNVLVFNGSVWRASPVPSINLRDLGDVNANAPLNGSTLSYNASVGQWEAKVQTPVIKLDDMQDVDVGATPSDGMVLMYSAQKKAWIAASAIGIAGGSSLSLSTNPANITIAADQATVQFNLEITPDNATSGLATIVANVTNSAYTVSTPTSVNLVAGVVASVPCTITGPAHRASQQSLTVQFTIGGSTVPTTSASYPVTALAAGTVSVAVQATPSTVSLPLGTNSANVAVVVSGTNLPGNNVVVTVSSNYSELTCMFDSATAAASSKTYTLVNGSTTCNLQLQAPASRVGGSYQVTVRAQATSIPSGMQTAPYNEQVINIAVAAAGTASITASVVEGPTASWSTTENAAKTFSLQLVGSFVGAPNSTVSIGLTPAFSPVIGATHTLPTTTTWTLDAAGGGTIAIPFSVKPPSDASRTSQQTSSLTTLIQAGAVANVTAQLLACTFAKYEAAGVKLVAGQAVPATTIDNGVPVSVPFTVTGSGGFSGSVTYTATASYPSGQFQPAANIQVPATGQVGSTPSIVNVVLQPTWENTHGDQTYTVTLTATPSAGAAVSATSTVRLNKKTFTPVVSYIGNDALATKSPAWVVSGVKPNTTFKFTPKLSNSWTQNGASEFAAAAQTLMAANPGVGAVTLLMGSLPAVSYDPTKDGPTTELTFTNSSETFRSKYPSGSAYPTSDADMSGRLDLFSVVPGFTTTGIYHPSGPGYNGTMVVDGGYHVVPFLMSGSNDAIQNAGLRINGVLDAVISSTSTAPIVVTLAEMKPMVGLVMDFSTDGNTWTQFWPSATTNFKVSTAALATMAGQTGTLTYNPNGTCTVTINFPMSAGAFAAGTNLKFKVRVVEGATMTTWGNVQFSAYGFTALTSNIATLRVT